MDNMNKTLATHVSSDIKIVLSWNYHDRSQNMATVILFVLLLPYNSVEQKDNSCPVYYSSKNEAIKKFNLRI